MQRMTAAGIAAVMAGMLSGCATVETPMADGYQPGDGLATLGRAEVARIQYCAETDPDVRLFRIRALQLLGAPIPDSGICTQLLEASPAELLGGNREQVLEDQRKFQEMLEKSRTLEER